MITEYWFFYQNGIIGLDYRMAQNENVNCTNSPSHFMEK